MATKKTRYIPEGYTTVTPYLMVRGAAKAIDFYKKAFNASELYRLPMPDGSVVHAELKLGNARLMLGEESAQMGALGPQSLSGTTVGLALYVEDCDALFKQAIAAGAKEKQPLADQFYGDRSGTVVDPFGHQWTISTHKEDVTPEEMARRMATLPPPA